VIHTLSVIFPFFAPPARPVLRQACGARQEVLTLPLAVNLARRETKFTWNFDLLEKAVTGDPARLFEQFQESMKQFGSAVSP